MEKKAVDREVPSERRMARHGSDKFKKAAILGLEVNIRTTAS